MCLKLTAVWQLQMREYLASVEFSNRSPAVCIQLITFITFRKNQTSTYKI